MDDKNHEEYRKRLKELIDRVEKNKDKNTYLSEQQLIEAKERLLQTTKSRVHSDFRNEKLIMVCTYNIRDYIRKRVDPTKEYQFQEEIDSLYVEIYEELKKPSPYLINLNLNKPSYSQADERDKRRILGHMGEVLGMKEMSDFIEKYKIDDILIGTTKDALLKVMAIAGMFTAMFVIIILFTLFISLD